VTATIKQRIEFLARNRGIDPDTWRCPITGVGFWDMTLIDFAEECESRKCPDTERDPSRREVEREIEGEDYADRVGSR